MANQIFLQNGCRISTPKVYPTNWESSKKEFQTKDWRISYYFYDPNFADKWKYGKLIVVKGMNGFKVTKDRVLATKTILENELRDLHDGYNPILKDFTENRALDNSIFHPELPIMKALSLAVDKQVCSKTQMKQYKYLIKRMEPAVKKLKMERIKIMDLKRSELKRILENMNLTDKFFNKIKAYLSSLFNELVEYECCETNITRDIRKKKVTTNKRDILTDKQYKLVMKYLKENYYEFWRYAQIFSYSGARTTELMLLTAENVDIENQEYKVIIKKGNEYNERIKVILPAVVPLWKELLKDAAPKDFLFSEGLSPGAKPINPDQIGKRWRRLVKKTKNIVDSKGNPVNITADFYALKHFVLDGLPPNLAQLLASHTTGRTTEIYRVNQDKRNREELKKLEIQFLKVV